MAYESVRILPLYSPNPSKQEDYTVICHSHDVRTVVTSKPAVVRSWVAKIRYRFRFRLRRGQLVVGLGVQWTPGRNPAPATLQLCVGHYCLIFQLMYTDNCPAALRRFLADPDVTFVGAWNYRDQSLLRNSPHGLRISRLVEVRDLASEWRGCGKGASLGRLAAEILGMDGVEKKEWVGRSNWEEEWLSEDQVEYACLDVFLVFLIARTLKAWKW